VGICSQGVTGAAPERPFEGVLEDPAETGLQAGGFFPPPLGLKLSFLLYLVRKFLKRNKNAFF
jgi:hypothetical protein